MIFCNKYPLCTTTSDMSQHDLYQETTDTYGDALKRLVCAYQPDPNRRRGLLQAGF